MKLNIKKIFSIFALTVMLSIPVLVYASTYSTTFNFYVSVQGSARSYNSGSINLKVTSTESSSIYASSSSYFKVCLYKKGLITSSKIGSFSAKRTGTTSDGWKNLDSGKYYLYLEKGNDGHYVHGSIKITQ